MLGVQQVCDEEIITAYLFVIGENAHRDKLSDTSEELFSVDLEVQ